MEYFIFDTSARSYKSMESLLRATKPSIESHNPEGSMQGRYSVVRAPIEGYLVPLAPKASRL